MLGRVLAAALVVGVWGTGCKNGSTVGIDDREGDRTSADTPPNDHPGDTDPGNGNGELCPPNCPPGPGTPLTRVAAPNPIPTENARPGNGDWRSGRDANSGEVELYTSVDSLAAGDTVQVKVSTKDSADVTVELYRIGYYGGAGARKVWSGGPYKTVKQPACPLDTSTGRVECKWSDTLSIAIAPEWPSGLYAVKVSRADRFRRFAPLVVRDARAAEVLFQPGFNTYQAYNTYGNESLYADGSGKMPTGMAVQVSFDRPYRDDQGLGKNFRLDAALAQFLEQNGYDVSYTANSDFLRYDHLLDGIGVFVHGGQDEYWDVEERRQIDIALAGSKLSLAYFGGNGGYWKTRALTDTAGNPLRTLVCYKGNPTADPFPGSTVRFRDDPDANPESKLFGVMYDGWQLIGFPLAVKDSSHWLFAGTGLTDGTLLQNLVGFEFDRQFDASVSPPGLSTPLESPVVTAEGLPNRSHTVVRTTASGRLVFSAGTIWWPLGISHDPALSFYDARVARMTLNVLERALSHRRAPRQLASAIGGETPPVNPPQAKWAQSVTALAGRAGVAGDDDGPASQATFNGPTGLAVTATGDIVVADTGNNKIRLIHRDTNTVETIAGTGALGLNNGSVPGASAMFRSPTGVAVGPDGAIYVADSDNHLIRRIEGRPPYTVTVFAGATRSQGFVDGILSAARFRRPTAVAFGSDGTLYVADQANNRIRAIKNGLVSTLAVDGINYLNNPSAVAVGPDGDVYVIDSANARLLRFDPGARTVTKIAGDVIDETYDPTPVFGYRDGTGNQAQVRAQMGLTVSSIGDVVFADTANFRVRKVVPGADAATSQVWTVAGSGKLGTRLGTGETSDITAPAGIAHVNDSQLVVSDSFHNVIRLITR